MNDYPPSGVLFTNNRKSKETQPDYTGSLELSDEVVNDLVDQISRGITKPKLSLAGWKKVSQKNGATYLSLRGNKFEERPQSNAQPSQPVSTALNDEVPF